jgi:hypothetical protein
MDHLIIDAINKAYDDYVSRLFAILCEAHEAEGLADFGRGMARAWNARHMALEEGQRLAKLADQPQRVDDSEWNPLDPAVSNYR